MSGSLLFYTINCWIKRVKWVAQSGQKHLTGDSLTYWNALHTHISTQLNFGKTLPECVIMPFILQIMDNTLLSKYPISKYPIFDPNKAKIVGYSGYSMTSLPPQALCHLSRCTIHSLIQSTYNENMEKTNIKLVFLMAFSIFARIGESTGHKWVKRFL